MFEIELFLYAKLNNLKENCVRFAKLTCLKWNYFMNKNGFGINNLKWLMCHKIKPSQIKISPIVWLHPLDLERKKLDKNYTRILHDVLEKSWKQHATKWLLSFHLIIWTRHAGNFWWNKDKLISDILLGTSTHGHTSVGQLAKSYIHCLCVDTGCRLEDLSRIMERENQWNSCCQYHKRIMMMSCLIGYGLYEAEIWLIYKCLIIIINIHWFRILFKK